MRALYGQPRDQPQDKVDEPAGQPEGWEDSGDLLLLWGGYETKGGEYGGHDLEVCCVADACAFQLETSD